jgi:hypothetical protein
MTWKNSSGVQKGVLASNFATAAANNLMSRALLKEAKEIALEVFHDHFFDEAFCAALSGIPRERITLDFGGAVSRIKNAIFFNAVENKAREEEIYGETDGHQIWLVRGLDVDQMIITLLHEALHDLYTIHRPTRSGPQKHLSCSLEHSVIYKLLPQFP